MTKAAIYCRVSTDDQTCERQIRDLTAYAEKAGYDVIGIFTETASGMKNDRAERNKILKLAQSRKIDVVLVTEMTRWGRSTVDLLETLKTLQSRSVSVVAQTGMQFDLSTPQGKMIAGVLATLSEFERDLIAERTKSGLAAAKARGKVLGRPAGNKAVIKHGKAVKSHLDAGKTVRWISDELHISTRTVMQIKAQQ
jgi:DNA invertase Pin-like site-specific DNA recombinase